METKRRSYKEKRRKLRILKRKLAIFTLITLCTLMGCLHFGKLSTDAHGNLEEDPVSFKYYKSIEIVSGDTLWDLAETHMDDNYGCVQDYIDEVKDMNGLLDDSIHDGQYLMIPYYE